MISLLLCSTVLPTYSLVTGLMANQLSPLMSQDFGLSLNERFHQPDVLRRIIAVLN
jgi:hypothetical protein